MNDLSLVQSNYNYYPNICSKLCVISYEPMHTIPNAVANAGLQVVWGPYQLKTDFDISYSRMFVAKRNGSDEHFVVIRGTNPLSLESWLYQDFDVGTTVPFSNFVPEAPSNALISKGTSNGMDDLLKLGSKEQDLLMSFLATVKGNIYVTGHSLGGTLSPTLFAYIKSKVALGNQNNMALWSFAGLTPGDHGFNTYFKSLINPDFKWRLHNTLDVATYLIYSQDDIENIYIPYGLKWGELEEVAIKKIFKSAEGKGFEQPVGGQALPGVFDNGIIDKHFWVQQAVHQHKITTYEKMIAKAFPLTITPEAC